MARSTVGLGAERLIVADRAVDLFGHFCSRSIQTAQIGLRLIEVGCELLPYLRAILGTRGGIRDRRGRARRQAVQCRGTLSDPANKLCEQRGDDEVSRSP